MELLEQHFDTAFTAPDGIKKLRELILMLAMQGKLVAQNSNDLPASQLLKEINAEKMRLVKEGKIKFPKPLPPLNPQEVPHPVPPGWQWVRLGNAIYVEMGQSPESKYYNQLGDGMPFFQGKADFGVLYPTPRYWCTHPEKYSYPNDILLSVRAPVGPTNIANIECCIGRGLAALRPLADVQARFINYLMMSFRHLLESAATGTTFVAVSKNDVENLVIPFPPLEEQHRIVAKIDQLMKRCDELERLRDEREQKRRCVHTAALNKLLDAQDIDSFINAWKFITQHFGELYAVRENVTELRKTILQLSVMGRLVQQNPNDSPASQLLKEIEAEKKRLVKEGKIKIPKPLPEIKQEDLPYALPQGWEWVRLGDIGISQTGTTPPSKNRENFGDFIPFIGPGDIKNNVINYSGEGLSEIGLSNGRLIEKDSVLMVCIGGSIGKHAVNDRDVTCNQQINTLTPYKPVSVNFLFYSMGAEWFQKNVIAQAGGSATPIINKQKWSSILVPLPPTSEQHRIVAKIDLLMTLCNALEQQIDAASSKQTALLDAVMAQV